MDSDKSLTLNDTMETLADFSINEQTWCSAHIGEGPGLCCVSDLLIYEFAIPVEVLCLLFYNYPFRPPAVAPPIIFLESKT